METMCPISLSRVNERVVRINAVLAVISIAVFLWTPFKWAVPVLAVDLFIRGFLAPSYSFYSAISKAVLGMFKTEPLMVDAGPKIFAARLGFIFCCVIFASHLLDYSPVAMIAGLCFILFASLEACFGFCVACKIYPLIHKFKN